MSPAGSTCAGCVSTCDVGDFHGFLRTKVTRICIPRVREKRVNIAPDGETGGIGIQLHPLARMKNESQNGLESFRPNPRSHLIGDWETSSRLSLEPQLHHVTCPNIRSVRQVLSPGELPTLTRDCPVLLGSNHQNANSGVLAGDVLVRRRLRILCFIQMETKKP